ncbi:MAG: type 1 glutamine amidotransferase [Halobacteriales archaeon]|nr:type 1 glutamine amidotransferase [Halobacteriales archaeon]
MSTLRLALLNAARNGDASRENFMRDVGNDLIEFNATACELPGDFEWDGVVVTGSWASTYWDEPWIDELRTWLQEADSRDIPMLGVCFGHQIVADALGGTVEDMGEYELGYREMTQTAESRLFTGIDDRFLAFATHHDQVTELPPGAQLIAENDCCIQGFQRGTAYGVQFHPEFDLETAERVAEGKDSIDEERRQRILDGVTQESYERACEAKKVFVNFRSIAAEHKQAEVAADD